jgi:hypothetical protein
MPILFPDYFEYTWYPCASHMFLMSCVVFMRLPCCLFCCVEHSKSKRRARNINVAYRWTHLILINVNLVQQDATIQDMCGDTETQYGESEKWIISFSPKRRDRTLQYKPVKICVEIVKRNTENQKSGLSHSLPNAEIEHFSSLTIYGT